MPKSTRNPKRGASEVSEDTKDPKIGKVAKGRKTRQTPPVLSEEEDDSNRSADSDGSPEKNKSIVANKHKAVRAPSGKAKAKVLRSNSKAKGSQAHALVDSDEESTDSEMNSEDRKPKPKAAQVKPRTKGKVKESQALVLVHSDEESVANSLSQREQTTTVAGEVKAISTFATPQRKYAAAVVVSPATPGSSASAPKITSIADLSIFKGSKVISAQVFEKSELREWNSKDGKKSGLLFSVKLKDSAGDTIQGTFFDGNEAFYDGVELNKVYIFYGGELKEANATYNLCTSNFEFTFSSKCQIELVEDAAVVERFADEETSSEPITISSLVMFKANQAIRAKVMARSPLRTFTTPKGTGCVFSVDLEDVSEKTIRATLFNDEAEMYYEILKEDNWYIFTGFAVKRSVHSYDECTSPYELRIEKGCKITLFLHTDPVFGDESST
jgi:hypothetical protein